MRGVNPSITVMITIGDSLVPRPHPQREKGLETLERFLGLVHHHMRQYKLIYENSHMIAEFAEPRIGSNVARSFPCTRGWIYERDYIGE